MTLCISCGRGKLVKIDVSHTHHTVNMGYGPCPDGFHRDRRASTYHLCCPKCKHITEWLNWDGDMNEFN